MNSKKVNSDMKITEILADLICQINERKEVDRDYKILKEKRKLLMKSIEEVETTISEMSDEEVGKL